MPAPLLKIAATPALLGEVDVVVIGGGRAKVDPTLQQLRYAQDFLPMFAKRRRSLKLGDMTGWRSGHEAMTKWRPDAPKPMESNRVLDSVPDREAIDETLRRARKLLPALSSVDVAHAWAGYLDSVLPCHRSECKRQWHGAISVSGRGRRESRMKTDCTLDRLDLRILTELQTRGRITNVELAEAVGLSASPCLARVKRLEKAGFIAGYGALLRIEKLGDFQIVFAKVTLVGPRREVFVRFVDAIRGVDEIMECHQATGDYDYLLKLVTRDIRHYQRVMEDLLERDIGIEKYFSYVVIKSPIAKTHCHLGTLFAALGGAPRSDDGRRELECVIESQQGMPCNTSNSSESAF